MFNPERKGLTMVRRMTCLLAGLGVAVLLSACANQNSIFRKNLIDARSPTILTVDAKQRHLIVAPDRNEANLGNYYWRTCAEASPDVFSALSTSAAADLGFGRSGTQTDAQAKAALAIAEAAGTIERTQTINLLRESMYRTCERYLSGAIDKTAFAVQAGRDWRAMIAILAIEQLTRVARPPSTVIAAGSTSAAVQSESDAVRQLIIAQGAEQEAQTAKQNAENDLSSSDCGTLTDENKAICDQKKKVSADSAAALAQATHRRETWEAIAKTYGQGTGSTASTGAGTSNAGGFATPPSAPSDMAAVSATVGSIVRQAFGTDETQLFCIQAINEYRYSADGQSKDLRQTCLHYLTEKVSQEANLFASQSVQTMAASRSTEIQETRQKVAEFLSSLDEAEYATERALLVSKIGSFCDSLSKAACISAVINGETDSAAPQVSAFIDERIRERRHQ
jgi:hypothetical protein